MNDGWHSSSQQARTVGPELGEGSQTDEDRSFALLDEEEAARDQSYLLKR